MSGAIPSVSDAAPERAPGRFVVGIDLGTTNCAVGYVDTNETAWKVRTFRVPQLVGAGQVEPRDTLPSFHYQPAPREFSEASMRLPWRSGTPADAERAATSIVGSFARDHGVLSQGRLIGNRQRRLNVPGPAATRPHALALLSSVKPMTDGKIHSFETRDFPLGNSFH